MKLNLLILCAIALSAYGLTVYLGSGTTLLPDQTTKNTDQSVSSFEFTDINGKTHNISDFKGKKIILNFWASWCAPCVKEFPILLSAANKNPDAVLIALSSDLNQNAIQKFLEKTKLDVSPKNILIALDENQAITGGVFNIFKLPETLIIDENQIIRHKFIGADWTEKELNQWLDNI